MTFVFELVTIGINRVFGGDVYWIWVNGVEDGGVLGDDFGLFLGFMVFEIV